MAQRTKKSAKLWRNPRASELFMSLRPAPRILDSAARE
jgi:hypothetical protein